MDFPALVGSWELYEIFAHKTWKAKKLEFLFSLSRWAQVPSKCPGLFLTHMQHHLFCLTMRDLVYHFYNPVTDPFLHCTSLIPWFNLQPRSHACGQDPCLNFPPAVPVVLAFLVLALPLLRMGDTHELCTPAVSVHPAFLVSGHHHIYMGKIPCHYLGVWTLPGYLVLSGSLRLACTWPSVHACRPYLIL